MTVFREPHADSLRGFAVWLRAEPVRVVRVAVFVAALAVLTAVTVVLW